jgi:IS30 family transposase
MVKDEPMVNNRPRQALGYLKPSEKFTELEVVLP